MTVNFSRRSIAGKCISTIESVCMDRQSSLKCWWGPASRIHYHLIDMDDQHFLHKLSPRYSGYEDVNPADEVLNEGHIPSVVSRTSQQLQYIYLRSWLNSDWVDERAEFIDHLTHITLLLTLLHRLSNKSEYFQNDACTLSNKKLSYRRSTARRTLLVDSCKNK